MKKKNHLSGLSGLRIIEFNVKQWVKQTSDHTGNIRQKLDLQWFEPGDISGSWLDALNVVKQRKPREEIH